MSKRLCHHRQGHQSDWLACLVAGLGVQLASCANLPPTGPTPGEAASAVASASAADPVTPQLVVVIVIDQMRYEMLARLGPTWTGGLRRALDEGVVFDQAHHAHATTYTAPGHASISTGTYPYKHGVAANDWPGSDGKEHSAAADPNARPLVPGALAGGPAGLRRKGLGDWLRAQHPASKVWSLAMKDRAAIMMGAQQPNGVIWWDVDAARHTSSTHYMPALPPWLLAYDQALDLEAFAAQPWELDPSMPPLASRPDVHPAEGKYNRFPHSVDEHRRGVGHWMRYHPRGDTMSVDLTLRLIDDEDLGRDQDPDLLWLGLSSGDWLGHRNGPNSVEVEMYYRQMDLELGRFFDELEGRGLAPLVVITSDHGVADIPQVAAAQGSDAVRLDPDPQLAELEAKFRGSEVCPDPGLHLVEDRGIRVQTPALEGPTRDRCLVTLAREIADFAWCEQAYSAPELEGRIATTRSEAQGAPADDPHRELYARSHVPGRSPEIALRLRPGYLFERGYKTGSAHGSVYPYDTHVPLIFMGLGEAQAGLRAEHRTSKVELVDVAATLASRLNLAAPADLDGSPLDL